MNKNLNIMQLGRRLYRGQIVMPKLSKKEESFFWMGYHSEQEFQEAHKKWLDEAMKYNKTTYSKGQINDNRK